MYYCRETAVVIRYRQYVKGKAISLQTRTDPEDSRRLRFPEFLGSLQMKMARLSALRTALLYPPGDTESTQGS